MRSIYCSFLLCLIAALAVASPNQARPNPATVRYVDIGDQGQSKLLAADASGNLFVVSQIVGPSGQTAIRATKTDPQGNTLASFDVPESVSARLAGAETDPQGNLVIAVNLFTPESFVVKLDSQLSQVLFSTQVLGMFPQALALDASGNIYVAGQTSGTNLTITGNPSNSPPPNSGAFSIYAALTEFSPDGSTILLATYFGSNQSTGCGAGIPCYATTDATSIVVDSGGAIVIAGSTNSPNLPVTPGVYAQQCGCASQSPAGFVAKFAPAGSSLLWATYLPATDVNYPSGSILALALALDGGVIVGGDGGDFGPAATPGVVQPALPQGLDSGFILKLNSTSGQLVFATYMGGFESGIGLNGVTSLASDLQGNIWATGGSVPSLLPSDTPLLGPTYTIALSFDATSVINAFAAPVGAAGQAIVVTETGAIITLGTAGSLIVGVPESGPSLIGVANSAAFSVSGYVAPYELISLYGIGIGPTNPMGAQVVNGNVGTSLGGVQVLFDGNPVPLLYAGPNQINALAPPFGEGQDTTVLQVVAPGGTTPGVTLQLRPSQPQVCRSSTLSGGVYAALSLNQDGSVNSLNNPAAPDSIVTIWATGAGIPNQVAPPWGSIVSTLLSTPELPVSVLTGANVGGLFGLGDSLEVLYAGDAPGMLTGVIQINFLIPSKPFFDPDTFVSGPEVVCAIQVGAQLSGLFGVYVQPQLPALKLPGTAHPPERPVAEVAH